MALRRGNSSDYLLSGLIRCGRCRRAYVGMSARNNGGIYHYYACSGRHKLGRNGCDGERIPRDKLEHAVLTQLASLIATERSSAGPSTRLPQGAGRATRTGRTPTRARRGGPPRRAQSRPLPQAFEDGDLDSGRFQTRLSALETRLDALRDQDAELAQQLAPEAATAPNSADLEAVADRLERTITEADQGRRKAYSDC